MIDLSVSGDFGLKEKLTRQRKKTKKQSEKKVKHKKKKQTKTERINKLK